MSRKWVGQGEVLSIQQLLRAGRLRSRGSINDGGKRFISFLKRPVDIGAQPVPFFTGGLGLSTRRISYRNMRLSTHLQLLPRSGMSAALSPLPPYVS
jgi:hypothetical protein